MSSTCLDDQGPDHSPFKQLALSSHITLHTGLTAVLPEDSGQPVVIRMTWSQGKALGEPGCWFDSNVSTSETGDVEADDISAVNNQPD